MNDKQVLGLEFLRGICAILVALAHCLHWGDVVLYDQWGLYSVSIFFVISGAVLYLNYRRLSSLDVFLVKRFARLAPLYALALIGTFVGLRLQWQWTLLVEPTMVFGLLGNECRVNGCWSLGVEFVLYTLFPILLAFTNSRRPMLLALLLLLGVRIAQLETIGGVLDGNGWRAYTQPGSFVALFFGGMVIAALDPSRHWKRWIVAVAALASLLGLFVVAKGASSLVGWQGIVNFALCLLAVACFFRIHLPLSAFLGQTSYGVYLLHPLVWGFLHSILKLPVAACIVLTLPATLGISWLLWKFYETPAKRWITRAYVRRRDPMEAVA